ncbi:hypothetical protein [Bradyrhizobium sp. CW10]|uniref:hypothetical protein n=1 Tax=Bradyrhizobium sp. CW10 TaxID=2782683 RepID=UPI001FF89F73|nr:hypothetical protein [Bradyrhizobium sp. CW10]MCK1469982.1 hypothetical protein [Bradyrhizobium sp. CW10]
MVLENCRAAYRIEDGVFWPTASTEEADALIQANTALSASQFGGAKTHLKNAASKLTEGDYPASVRESISAAESVARVLEPTGDLSKALSGLEQRIALHPALKKAFLSLYGYTSDEKGIRHALLSEGAAIRCERARGLMDGFEGFERIEERLRLAAIQFLPALELSSTMKTH